MHNSSDSIYAQEFGISIELLEKIIDILEKFQGPIKTSIDRI